MELLKHAVDSLAAIYPPDVRAEIEAAMPQLVTDAARLATEVLDAEQRGIPFAEAANTHDFPRIARMHYGVEDLLQRRVPEPLRATVREIFTRAARGEFDGLRRSWFVGAARKSGPEAALLRFGLYQAARMNLYVASWEAPEVEAAGALDEINLQAQAILYDLLETGAAEHAEVRPLHLYVSELVVFANAYLAQVRREAEQSPDVRARLAEIANAISFVRQLAARDAALLRLSSFEPEVGDRRLQERYSDHFGSQNAIRVHRTRFRKRAARGERLIDDSNERLIDMVRDAAASLEAK